MEPLGGVFYRAFLLLKVCFDRFFESRHLSPRSSLLLKDWCVRFFESRRFCRRFSPRLSLLLKVCCGRFFESRRCLSPWSINRIFNFNRRIVLDHDL